MKNEDQTQTNKRQMLRIRVKGLPVAGVQMDKKGRSPGIGNKGT